MVNKKRLDYRWIVLFVVMILLIVSVYFYFQTEDRLGLVPSNGGVSGNVITGNVIYNIPFTLDQLREGVVFDAGWNYFYWTNEIEEDIPLTDALNSIVDNIYYVYSYSESKYWFNPDGPYGVYNNHPYFSSRLFDQIKKGQRYGISMVYGDVLVYDYGSGTAPPQNNKLEFMEGHVIVKFKKGTSFGSVAGEGEGSSINTNKDSVNQILRNHLVESYKQINKEKAEEVLAGYFGEGEASDLFEKSYLLKGVDDTLQAVSDLEMDSNIEYAQPNYIYYSDFVPNDERYGEQWAHQITNAEAGWDIEMGSPEVVIAVIDSGVDFNHEDLKDNMLSDCVDGCSEGTGYDFVDVSPGPIEYFRSRGLFPFEGVDYFDKDDIPFDNVGHGTHVAGVAASKSDNNIGGSGVCPNCKIMPLRVSFPLNGEEGMIISNVPQFEGDNLIFDADMSDATYYAVDNDADVISLSATVEVYSENFRGAVDYAEANDVVFVSAAGNENSGREVYPCAFDSVLCVGSVDSNGSKSDFSNFGSWLDFSAPGGNPGVLTTTPFDDYDLVEGTSFSTPYVSGLVGLILSKNPELTSDQVRTVIKQSVNPNTGVAEIGGIVDVERALQIVEGLHCGGADINRNGVVDIGDVDKYIKDFKSECRNVGTTDILNVVNAINGDRFPGSCDESNSYCEVMDFKPDGFLTAFDVLVLINLFNNCESIGNPHVDSNADLNGDGYINRPDRLLLIRLLGEYPMGSSCDLM
ncbi:hypothetical protein CMI38_06410 [Candidatus Pacearchaeota archaeon]|nr:hypothetical protein [Candidatus Pacearchaeota archaeon]|tara:strand:- start:598 stop:2832 length:2235 start_codon:yes stop_codon:yes gene_type:complete